MENGNAKGGALAVLGIAIAMLMLFSGAFAAGPYAGSMKEAREKARGEMKQVAESYRESVSEYRDARNDFLAARTGYLGGLRKPASERDVTQEAVLEKSKTYLLKSADQLLRLIDFVRNEAILVTSFNSTDGAALEALQGKWLSELDSAEESVLGLKDKMASATNRTSLAEASREMKGAWTDVRKLAHRIYYLARVEKGIVLYRKTAFVSEKLGSKTAELASLGADTSAVSEKLARVGESLESAKSLFSSAKIAFGNNDLPEGNRLMRDSRNELASGMKFLRETYTDYLEVAREYRARVAETADLAETV